MSMQLLEALKWRYAVKSFDPSKKIAPETWAQLEEALVLSASSYGLQPWKFVVVESAALREELKAHAWGQSQITDASHLVVLCRRKTVDAAFIEKWVARMAEVRGIPAESLDGYKGMMIGDLVDGPRSAQIADWAARQAYLALGNLLTSAAILGVDTCPMEGFAPQEFDRILNLADEDLASVVVCTLGMRSEEDPYAKMAKVRYEKADVLEKK
jgi:nitroreductase